MDFDWARAIERNSEALKGIVENLFALLGIASGLTLATALAAFTQGSLVPPLAWLACADMAEIEHAIEVAVFASKLWRGAPVEERAR